MQMGNTNKGAHGMNERLIEGKTNVRVDNRLIDIHDFF